MQCPQPYFRSFDGWWYVQIRESWKRRQVKLAKGRENEEAARENRDIPNLRRLSIVRKKPNVGERRGR